MDDQVLPGATRPLVSRAALSRACTEAAADLEVEQRAHVRVHGQDHASAMAAVAAIRTAFGNVLLTAKADASVSTASRDDIDGGAIGEHQRSGPFRGKRDTPPASTAKQGEDRVIMICNAIGYGFGTDPAMACRVLRVGEDEGARRTCRTLADAVQKRQTQSVTWSGRSAAPSVCGASACLHPLLSASPRTPSFSAACRSRTCNR